MNNLTIILGIPALVILGLMFILTRRQWLKQQQYRLDLQERENLLRTIIDENPSVILLKDWDGRFIFGNRALANLYGTTTENLVDKDDGAFNPNKEQVEFYRENVRDIMRKGEAAVVMEESTDVVTGQSHYYQSIKKPLKDRDGNLTILVIASDVTDLQVARRQSEESDIACVTYSRPQERASGIGIFPAAAWSTILAGASCSVTPLTRSNIPSRNFPPACSMRSARWSWRRLIPAWEGTAPTPMNTVCSVWMER